MRFLEYGNVKNEKIIMIHGANIPWQMWDTQIAYFSKQYYVIVPVLDGHDCLNKNNFISVQKSAKDIEDYYFNNYGAQVFAMIGMSMGAAIIWNIVSDGKIRPNKLIFDSGVFVSANPIITKINIKMQLNMNHNAKLRDKKTLKKLEAIYGKKLLPHYLEMVDSMEDQSLVNTLESVGNYQLPPHLNVNGIDIIAFHGTDFMEIMAKKSAKYLQKYYPNSYIKCFHGYHHGELSVNRPDEFIMETECVEQ